MKFSQICWNETSVAYLTSTPHMSDECNLQNRDFVFLVTIFCKQCAGDTKERPCEEEPSYAEAKVIMQDGMSSARFFDITIV